MRFRTPFANVVAIVTMTSIVTMFSAWSSDPPRPTADPTYTTNVIDSTSGSAPESSSIQNTESPPTEPASSMILVTPSTLGLSPPGELNGVVTHNTTTFADRERTFRLCVPNVLPDGPVPLFIGLHGGTGSGDQFAATNQIERLAETNGFIVVHPDGVRVAGGRGGVWNGGVCCGWAARDDVDDVGFVNALIDQLERDHEIDTRRIFAFGHSNGGIMSYRLACELADRIVGIGVVAGTLGVEECEPSQAVSIIHVHGTADESLPIAGGVGPNSIAGVEFPSPIEGFETLAALIGCPGPDLIRDGDVTTSLREPCTDESSAALVTIETASHAWPGATNRAPSLVGEPYALYDATTELVSFLLSHPRP